jgi:hypothetical protein
MGMTMSYRDAKKLAVESLLKTLREGEYDLIDESLVVEVIDASWGHQGQEEPRKEARDEIKVLVEAQAKKLERMSDS